MKQIVFILCILVIAAAGWAAEPAGCRNHGEKKNCAPEGGCRGEQGGCSPEKRGRCGKRRGDWYGARQPVADAAEARRLLTGYYADENYTISALSEKRWGFRADIIDRNGVVIDRVMVDKRSGRIRSLD